MSEIIQTLHEAYFIHDEQFSALGELQIPNTSPVINFRTDSNVNLP
jgi:hypothetical protein